MDKILIGNKNVDFDFHIHTKPGSSDAGQTISEMIETAKLAGIKTVAITDHNDITSLKDAIPLCASNGIELICGVEFSVSIIGISKDLDYNIVHVLGLGIKPDENLFIELCGDIKQKYKIWESQIKTAAERNFNIKFKGETIYEIRDEMISLGIFENRKEAKRWTRSYKGSDVTPLVVMSISDVVDTIHKLGGIAVLAHPNRGENHKVFSLSEIEQIVDYLVKKGLMELKSIILTL